MKDAIAKLSSGKPLAKELGPILCSELFPTIEQSTLKENTSHKKKKKKKKTTCNLAIANWAVSKF